MRKAEFYQKWTQLVSFLVELESEKENNWLFRLTDRMKKYGKEVSKVEGVLYSEQLGGILGMKGQIKLEGVSEEDLFWLI